MKDIYKIHLFNKHVLVNDFDPAPEHAFESNFAFAKLLGVKIVKGKELACPDLISFAASRLGEYVPQPFYKGFPETVRKLSPDELLFDQLLHYAKTYGFGFFDEPGSSVLEEEYKRTMFKEKVEPKNFDILNENDAVEVLGEYINNLLSSTRPLNDYQYEVVMSALNDYHFEIKDCPCKDTAIRLIIDRRDASFAKFLRLPDFIKTVEMLNFYLYDSENGKKLNLKNKDRVLLSKVLDTLFEKRDLHIKDCFEKQQLWCGFLHHLHYKPKNERAQKFMTAMRTGKNDSAYSSFEQAMSAGSIEGAVNALVGTKGSGAFMRKLNYVLSRCTTDEQVKYVIDTLETKNNIILIQLLMQYANYKPSGARTFKFTKFNRMRVHDENEKEIKSRKSVVPQEIIDKVVNTLYANLKGNLAGKLGKVYVDESMKKIALPLQENTSMGGFGTLTKGSRVDIPDGKKVRAFTYWEKVNDIDLSVIGIDDQLRQHEFSWRTMASNQSNALTFSGDQTSGYNGGSEYYDMDLDALKKRNPNIRYYILCNNVYSGTNFNDCFCKAGFMSRDVNDSGQVYEPKTVQSAYIIDTPSTFAYLYAIDVQKRQLVWLNMARASTSIVAGATKLDFLLDYMNATDVINVHSLFTMLATEITENPADADVVVSDAEVQLKDGATQIKSYDTDKILPLIN